MFVCNQGLFEMKVFVDANKSRLICLSEGCDSSYWDQHWAEKKKPKPAKLSSEFVIVTKKYLPIGSKILEGGAGLGDKVEVLQRAGFKPIGVDFAKETVSYVKSEMPHIDIRFGQVQKLQFSDFEFDGYWSIGVIEHFYSGYSQVLSEAYRVLKPGGYLFLTFPSLSPVRKLKIKLGIYPCMGRKDCHEPEGFYQYILDSGDVCRDLKKEGFAVVSRTRRSATKGIKEDMPFVESFFIWMSRCFPVFVSKTARYLIRRSLKPLVGHSTIVVAEKRTS